MKQLFTKTITEKKDIHKNMKNEEKVAQWAYFSRIILVLLQYIANQLIPDHNAKVFMYPVQKNNTDYDKFVDHLLGGFLRWDAQYFMHIAKYGYTYENTLAFFPFYPLLVGYIGDFIADIVGLIYIDSILLLTFTFVNIYIFKQAALTLYRLTESLFNRKIAYDSAILYCFNPASIFFIAPYSECIFSYLTFLGMLNCLKLYEKYSKPENVFSITDLLLIMPIALSTVTRSNGILNIGFLLYSFICLYLRNIKNKQAFWTNFYSVIRYGFAMLMTTLDCLLPFLLYQYYCYTQFCRNFTVTLPSDVLDHAKRNKFVLPGSYSKNKQKWCQNMLPMAYSYVQDHYWDVGFLRYYDFKQIPNFILAMPILSILIYSSVKHLYVNIIRRKFYSIFIMENPSKIRKAKVQIAKCDLYQPRLTVYYIHSLLLSIFCTFFIHIQVSTRLLCSASPVVYWVCSRHLNLLKLPAKTDTLCELFLRTYFVSFFIAGVLLFCNFLPWT